MSFILDALKKSENERQRQIGPSLADIPVRRTREDRPWWAVAVAALLVINLGVLLIVLLRDRNSSRGDPSPAAQASLVQPQAAPAAAPTNDAVPPPPVASAPAPMRSNPAVRSLADAAGTDAEWMEAEESYNASIAGAAAVPEGPPVVRPISGPTVVPMNQPTFAARDQAGGVVAQDENLTTHGALVAGGTHLPDLRLDIHVYAPAPRDRFVFVNMRKYVEGQSISEGPLLERITPNGAVMNHNGTRFLLPRQ